MYGCFPPQDNLECEFPDLYTIRFHKDVLLYTCCLSDQPEVILKFICDSLARHEQTALDLLNLPRHDYFHEFFSSSDVLRNIVDDVSRFTCTNLPVAGLPVFEKESQKLSIVPPYIMFIAGTSMCISVSTNPDPVSEANDRIAKKESTTCTIKTCVDMQEEVSQWLHLFQNNHKSLLIFAKGLTIHCTLSPGGGKKLRPCLTYDLSVYYKEQIINGNTTRIFDGLKNVYTVRPRMVSFEHVVLDFNDDHNQMGLESLKLAKNCEYLIVQMCRFPESMWYYIGDQILNSNLLRYIDLCNSGGGFQELGNTLISSICHCRHLEEIQLEACELSREQVTELFNAIANGAFPNLKVLNLSHNVLTGCISILLKCKEYLELETLELQYTALSKEDIQALNELGKNDMINFRS